jgi:hypothetical protein
MDLHGGLHLEGKGESFAALFGGDGQGTIALDGGEEGFDFEPEWFSLDNVWLLEGQAWHG